MRTPTDWLRDRRGSAGLEFGLLATLLITLVVGTFEIAQGWAAAAKLKGTAEAVAQLVAMETTVNSTEINDICVGAQMMIRPFSAASLGLEIGVVTIGSTGSPSVTWRSDVCAANGTTDLTKTLSGLTLAAGASVVVVRASYVFTSSLLMFLPNAITLRGDSVVSPRLDTVVWSGS